MYLLSATALEFGFGRAAVFPVLSIARIPDGSKPDTIECDFKPRRIRRQLRDENGSRNTALRSQVSVPVARGFPTPGSGKPPVTRDENGRHMTKSRTYSAHAARKVHMIRRNDD